MSGNEYIKLKRLEKGLSLQALSKKCGVSFSRIASVERGEHKILFDNLLKILDGLDASMYDFLNVVGYFPPSYMKETDVLVAGGGFEPSTICNAVLQADSQAA
ncbi:MAG: helix-turn-helix transcriptional regulator [Nitrospirae bacterium]|nr:helix-turn-helix transcriptional regulator [Nitrospirota bacterium]